MESALQHNSVVLFTLHALFCEHDPACHGIAASMSVHDGHSDGDCFNCDLFIPCIMSKYSSVEYDIVQQNEK